MKKNTSEKKDVLAKVEVQRNTFSAPSRNASIFTTCPTIDLQLAYNGKLIASLQSENMELHKQANIAAQLQAQRTAIDSVAEKAWIAYHQTELHIPYVNATRIQAININTAMLSLTDSMDDRKTIQIQRKGNNRLQVNGNSICDHQKVYQTIISYNGASFKDLPVEVQQSMSKAEIDRYNKIKPFYHTLHNGTGKGIFALMVQTYGKELTPVILDSLQTGIDINGQRVSTDKSSIDFMKAAIANFR